MQAVSARFTGLGFEALSLRPSRLQQVAPRVKLLLLAAFTVAVATTPVGSWGAFAVHAAMLGAALAAGRLPLRPLACRLAVVLPFVAMAALLIPLHPSIPAGVSFFLNFAVKALLGAGAALVLAASTPFPRLLEGLEALHVPQVVVMIFGFTYRYFFVLADEALRMKRARDSRGYQGRWLADAAVIGRMAGTLFLRSYERGERVYLAMLSRGFEKMPGAPVSRKAERLTLPDLSLLAGCLLLLAIPWAAARFSF